MTINPRRLGFPIKLLMIAAIASAAIASAGCGGDNPSNLAGTIELPERKFSPPPDAKSFAKDKAKPKNPNP